MLALLEVLNRKVFSPHLTNRASSREDADQSALNFTLAISCGKPSFRPISFRKSVFEFLVIISKVP